MAAVTSQAMQTLSFCATTSAVLRSPSMSEWRHKQWPWWTAYLTENLQQSVKHKEFHHHISVALFQLNLKPTYYYYYYYYYYNRFTTLCSGPPRWVGTRRINHSGFCWSRHDGVAMASAELYASYLHFTPEDNHASTSSLKFLWAGCPSWHPTNSVKALKAHLQLS